MSHCRTVFPIYSLLHSRHRPLPQCKGFHLVENFIVDLHGFVDESWMGAPTDLAGVDERAPISKTLPHDVAGIEGVEPGPHHSASIFFSLCDLPALLDPWGNPGQ